MGVFDSTMGFFKSPAGTYILVGVGSAALTVTVLFVWNKWEKTWDLSKKTYEDLKKVLEPALNPVKMTEEQLAKRSKEEAEQNITFVQPNLEPLEEICKNIRQKCRTNKEVVKLCDNLDVLRILLRYRYNTVGITADQCKLLEQAKDAVDSVINKKLEKK